MNETKNRRRPAGIGTGYLSLMMIFVTLCLTALAALSLSAAENEKRFSEKSADYTAEYYAADLEAKKVLAEIDSVVSGYSDYMDFMLLAELDEMESVSCENGLGNLTVSWKTPINDRQDISCKVIFSDGSFEIMSWRTVSSAETESAPLGIWLGE